MTVELKAVLPKKFNVKAFDIELSKSLKKIADDIEKDFILTVNTWSRRPKFDKTVKPASIARGTKEVKINVDTADVVYGYVTRGTGSHVITAKEGRLLQYAIDSVPKTRQRVIGSSSGSPGSIFYREPEVVHPGIRPRMFEETIAEKWRPLFQKRMETAMARAVAASGHKLKGSIKAFFGRLFG